MSYSNNIIKHEEGGEMLFNKKKVEKRSYDKATLKPVLKASICNYEKIAGFKEIKTGKFHEDMLITSPNDLQRFMEAYDLTEDQITKEW